MPVTAHPTITSNASLLFERWAINAYPLICTRQPRLINPSHLQLAIPYFDGDLQQKYRFSFIIKKTDGLVCC